MATKRPLCIYGGRVEELRTADSVPPTSGLILRRGNIHRPSAYTAAGLTTFAVTSGRLYYAPFFVGRETTIDQVGCEVTTAGAGSTVHAGIYGAQMVSGVEHPGALLASMSADGGTTGMKSGSISPAITLQPGQWYWTAMLATGGTAPAVRAIAATAFWPVLNLSSVTPVSYIHTSGHSALPSTAPTSGYTSASGSSGPAVHVVVI